MDKKNSNSILKEVTKVLISLVFICISISLLAYYTIPSEERTRMVKKQQKERNNLINHYAQEEYKKRYENVRKAYYTLHMQDIITK